MESVFSPSGQLSDEEKAVDDDKLVDDSLISFLYPGGYPGGSLELEYERYLAQLTSYSLDRLNSEPDALSNEGRRIKQEMEQLAFSNYKAFIQTSQCVQDIHREMSRVSKNLSLLLHNLPALSNACKDFCTEAHHIAKRRALNRLTLQAHTQLLEILEIPQLMDTCVRNGYYEEALELQAYAHKLSKLHPNLPIIQDIAEEVTGTTDMMLYQLHQQLRSNIQLPVCLRVIGYLKRLEIYTERELRLSFLRSRGAWLHSVLSSIPTNNAYTYLTKLTDYSRTHLFDIITQYRAIFSDEASLQDQPLEDGGLLYGWMVHIIDDFIQTLDKYLPQITEGISLSNILDQCMYYGISLGRVGVDFRGLLVPLFERSVYTLFSNAISNANSYLADSLKSHKLIAMHKPSAFLTADSKDQTTPPASLLDHPPVAILTNGYIAALNELRQCAPLSLQARLAERLREGLLTVAQTLQNYKKELDAGKKLDADEEKVFGQLCQTASEKFVPYVVRCFDLIFKAGRVLVDASEAVALLDTLYDKQPALPDPAAVAAARFLTDDDPTKPPSVPPSPALASPPSSSAAASAAPHAASPERPKANGAASAPEHSDSASNGDGTGSGPTTPGAAAVPPPLSLSGASALPRSASGQSEPPAQSSTASPRAAQSAAPNGAAVVGGSTLSQSASRPNATEPAAPLTPTDAAAAPATNSDWARPVSGSGA